MFSRQTVADKSFKSVVDSFFSWSLEDQVKDKDLCIHELECHVASLEAELDYYKLQERR